MSIPNSLAVGCNGHAAIIVIIIIIIIIMISSYKRQTRGRRIRSPPGRWWLSDWLMMHILPLVL
jgi:hypothetical protein